MADSYLAARLAYLRSTQGSDGGWGYFPRKQSWLEPTAYAAMALLGEPAADKAWELLKSWQMADGSWKPSADVQLANWGTSLCVTLAMARREWGDATRNGVTWLLGSAGVESNWINRAAARVGLLNAERDLSLKGWPWKEGTSSWVEPTSHALVALKTASSGAIMTKFSTRVERIQSGEAQLLDVRCRDGGWNYGSRAVLDDDLRSYPETTGIALLGLQGVKGIGTSIDLAARMLNGGVAPMARAWLTVALRLHGQQVPALAGPLLSDILITAIQALACPEGNYKVMLRESVT